MTANLTRRLQSNGKKVIGNLRLIGVAATLYVFVMWIKHAFFWFFALLPMGGQSGSLIENIGAVNSLLTLLIAALVSVVACLPLIRKSKKINLRIIGTTLILIGSHFAIYLIGLGWGWVGTKF